MVNTLYIYEHIGGVTIKSSVQLLISDLMKNKVISYCFAIQLNSNGGKQRKF